MCLKQYKIIINTHMSYTKFKRLVGAVAVGFVIFFVTIIGFYFLAAGLPGPIDSQVLITIKISGIALIICIIILIFLKFAESKKK